jgi:hypothetical protein
MSGTAMNDRDLRHSDRAPRSSIRVANERANSSLASCLPALALRAAAGVLQSCASPPVGRFRRETRRSHIPEQQRD